MTTIDKYYIQDGADFYLYESLSHYNHLEAFGDESDVVLTCCTYPEGVTGDYDVSGAKKALEWFLKVYCRENSINPISI